jgi:putative membrane protein
MSVRVYTGPHADRSRGTGLQLRRRLAPTLAVVAIGLQVCWPLTSGPTRDVVTVSAVVAFFFAVAAHAVVVRGTAWACGWLLISGGLGLGAEVLGMRTGLPFGDYTYADRLGPELLGVPVVIGLAWAMMSYPCLLAGRRLTRHPVATAALAGLLLASWDLFLDPQMVAEGHWSWQAITTQLPGIPGVPLQNFVGWLLVAVVLMLVLDRLPRRGDDGAVPPDGVPLALLTWTWLSNVALAAAIDHRPGAALWGGLVMGAVLVPYLVVVWVDRP